MVVDGLDQRLYVQRDATAREIGRKSLTGRACTSRFSLANGRSAQPTASTSNAPAAATNSRSRASDCSNRLRMKAWRDCSVSAIWMTTRWGEGWPSIGRSSTRA